MKTANLRFASVAFSLLTLMSARPAIATLGEVESSVDADATTLHATLSATQSSGQVRARVMKTKISSVKQYTDENGRVYAISWLGAKHPDLSVLMGSYYSEYATALHSRRGASLRRNSTVATSQVVVHLSGVPRHMHGLVYVPALLPSGVKAEDLK